MKILVTGAFDIVHIGHIRMLEYAKSLGKTLFVAIDDNERITDMIGLGRPFNNQLDRKEFLLSLKAVDNVFIFSSDSDLEEICRLYKPDIRVVGSDWKGKPIIAEKYCKRIEYFDRINGYSTTRIIDGN